MRSKRNSNTPGLCEDFFLMGEVGEYVYSGWHYCLTMATSWFVILAHLKVLHGGRRPLHVEVHDPPARDVAHAVHQRVRTVLGVVVILILLPLPLALARLRPAAARILPVFPARPSSAVTNHVPSSTVQYNIYIGVTLLPSAVLSLLLLVLLLLPSVWHKDDPVVALAHPVRPHLVRHAHLVGVVVKRRVRHVPAVVDAVMPAIDGHCVLNFEKVSHFPIYVHLNTFIKHTNKFQLLNGEEKL